MARSPIAKGESYGDFTPIGRKKTATGTFRFQCRCVNCGAIRDFAESTLRAKPSCHACKEKRDGKRMDAGELPENIAAELATFKADAPGLLDILDDLDDVPGTALAKESIKMLITLIPEAEVAYRSKPTQGQAYALNSIVSNIRELQRDLEEKAAHADLAGEIMTKVMQPKFHEIARILADAHYSMTKLVSPYVEKKRRKRVQRGMEDAIKDVGSKLEAIYSDIEKGLQGRIR